MARDSQGRWLKGSSGNAGGITSHEFKAARRLKQRLAGMVDEAESGQLRRLVRQGPPRSRPGLEGPVARTAGLSLMQTPYSQLCEATNSQEWQDL